MSSAIYNLLYKIGVLYYPCCIALLAEPPLYICKPFFPVLRYNQAKDLAKELEKQATKVHAEAEEAGNRALQIYANLTSIPQIDTTALQVNAILRN